MGNVALRGSSVNHLRQRGSVGHRRLCPSDEHGSLEEGLSLQAALQAGHQARTDYYDSRLRLLQGIKPMQTLASVMDQRGTSALAIEDAVSELDRAGFNGKEALDKAIAHGVLAEDSPGAVSFGIPSFHGYMVALGR